MAQLTHSPHPLSPNRDRAVIAVPIIGNPTLAEVLTGNNVDFQNRPIVVQLNGEVVPRSGLSIRTVRDSDMITVRAGVAGHGSAMIAELVVLIAVTVLTYGAGSSLAVGAMGATTFGISTNLVVMVAGTLIVAGITALTAAPQAIRGSTGSNAPSQYAINGISNNARPMQPIPVVLGTIKMFPDVAAAPYTDFEGTDEYLYSLFNFGLGNLAITDLELGSTDLSSYDEVTQQFSDLDTGAITLFPGDVQTEVGSDLTYNVPVVRTTAANTTQIGLDFTGTLFTTNNDGSFGTATCYVQVQYRRHGDATWINWMSAEDADIAQSQYALWQSYYMATGTQYNAQAQNSLTLSNNTQNPVRETLVRQVPSDTYDVQVTLLTPPPSSATTQQAITWASLKSYLPDTANYKGQTRLALKIKASGQLNGSIQQLSGMVSNQIPNNPSYDGETWVDTSTSNPAWQYLYVCRGLFDDAGNRIFGAGLADNRIDIAGLIEWAQYCDENNLSCDLILNSSMVVADVLNVIAQCGRGQLDYSKGIVGAIWDEGGLSPVQMFGMGNIKAGSFQVMYQSDDLADQFTVNFNNKDLGYQPDSVSALLPGVTVPSNPTQVDFLGITDKDQAGRQANLLAASQFYRVRQVQFEADIEGLVASKGDVILLSHDLTSWSKSGRLQSGTTTQLVLDQEITFTAASQPYIMVRLPDSTFQTCRVVESSGTTNTITLADALTQAPSSDPDGKKPMDYLYFFDPAATPGERMKVLSKQYMGNDANWVQIICTDDPAAYYDAENGDFTYVTPNLLNQGTGQITNVVISEQLISSTNNYVTLTVNWNIANANGTHVRYRLAGDTSWTDAGIVYQPQYQFNVYSATDVTVELTPINLANTAANQFSSVVQVYTIVGLGPLPEGVVAQMPNVTGLQIVGDQSTNEFTGQDAKFTWRTSSSASPELGSEQTGGDSGAMDPYFLNYKVQISNLDGSVRRTDYTQNVNYTYTYEMNREDGPGSDTATREFIISVWQQGTSNQLSAQAAQLTVSNPAPAVPTGVVFTSGVNFVTLDFDPPPDNDYAGTTVTYSTNESDTATTDLATLEAHGGGLLQVVTSNNIFINDLAAGTPYYFFLTPYDMFGQDGTTSSSQYTCATILIESVDLGPGSVIETTLADAAVATAKIKAGAVDSTILADESVLTSKLADAAVATAKIADDAVTTDQLASAAVETANIQSAAITNALIASSAVNTINIDTAAITTALIASGAVTGASIAASTITASNITAGTITGSLIAAATIAGTNISGTTITASNIAASTITTTQIAANTIVAANIASATITSAQITSGTITATLIASGTITVTQLAAGSVTSAVIAAGTIVASDIASSTITASQIAASTITTTQIAATTIQGSNIAAATITGGMIQAASITGGNIAANTITGSLIAATTIIATNIVADTITTNEIHDNAVSSTVASSVGSFSSTTAFTSGSYQTLSTVAFGGTSLSAPVLVTVSVDATVSGSTGSFISARIQRSNNGTFTTLWEGLSDAGNASKSYAQIKGSYQIVDTPPNNGFANTYFMQINGSGGTNYYYNICTISATTLMK